MWFVSFWFGTCSRWSDGNEASRGVCVGASSVGRSSHPIFRILLAFAALCSRQLTDQGHSAVPTWNSSTLTARTPYRIAKERHHAGSVCTSNNQLLFSNNFVYYKSSAAMGRKSMFLPHALPFGTTSSGRRFEQKPKTSRGNATPYLYCAIAVHESFCGSWKLV